MGQAAESRTRRADRKVLPKNAMITRADALMNTSYMVSWRARPARAWATCSVCCTRCVLTALTTHAKQGCVEQFYMPQPLPHLGPPPPPPPSHIHAHTNAAAHTCLVGPLQADACTLSPSASSPAPRPARAQAMEAGTYEPITNPRVMRVYDLVPWLLRPAQLKGKPTKMPGRAWGSL